MLVFRYQRTLFREIIIEGARQAEPINLSSRQTFRVFFFL